MKISKSGVILTIWPLFFLLCTEWIFQATKSSFMSMYPPFQKVVILFISPLPLGIALVLISPFLYFSVGRRLLFSFLMSSAFLLMLDNMTQTLLSFGIKDGDGAASLIYLAVFTVLLYKNYKWAARIEAYLEGGAYSRFLQKGTFLLTGSICAAGVLAVLISWQKKTGWESHPVAYKPNILFLASDGLNADRMSAYGYHRDTTPFLNGLKKEMLVFNRAFANATSSGGSIISMFTGKNPATTGVVFPPDILRGHDVFQHFPGILKGLGYRNIDISIRHYADPYDMNLRNGFHRANTREAGGFAGLSLTDRYLGSSPAFFLQNTMERIKERLFHILFIRKMSDPYQEVRGHKKKGYDINRDKKRVEDLLTFIQGQKGKGPFFAHLHLLGTHLPHTRPQSRMFSENKILTPETLGDFYDDAVLDFDRAVEKIIKELKEHGLLEETIIVIHSDHAFQGYPGQMIPLMIRFPGHEITGTVGYNVSNLDIAPTILDYLKLNIPPWMEGRSFLKNDPLAFQDIFVVSPPETMETRDMWWILDPRKIRPPFFNIGAMTIIGCNEYRTYYLPQKLYYQAIIRGQQIRCESGQTHDDGVRFNNLKDHLKMRGFDVSGLYFKDFQQSLVELVL